MFSLTYSAAYDPYHSVFRFLALYQFVDDKFSVDFESIRIADFYHSFPWLLADFSAYTKISGFLKEKNQVVKRYPPTRFDVLPDKRLVFRRMLASQYAARSALVECGGWTTDGETVSFSANSILSPGLTDAVQSYCTSNNELLTFLVKKLICVPLLGPGGLKDRSGLGEFRYDVL